MASDIASDTRRARDRAERLSSINAQLRRIVSTRQAEAFAVVPVGSMTRLGPSIVNLQHWSVNRDGFTFGTLIDYAAEHAEFRAADLGEPLLYVDDTLSDRVFDAWAEFVFGPLTV